MKNLYVLLLILVAGTSVAQIINIPDANFKAALLSSNIANGIAKDSQGVGMVVDTNSDGEVDLLEAILVYSLNVSYSNIAELTGIDSFWNVGRLDCQGNQMTTLDVSGMLLLTYLDCSYNNLTSVVTMNSNLLYFNCAVNQLTSLDLTNLPSLQEVNCRSNQIAMVNVNGTTNPGVLDCGDNLLTSIDLTGLSNLEVLGLENNLFTSVSFAGAENIGALDIYGNQLTTLDVSGLTHLVYLNCYSNNLVSMIVKNGFIESDLNFYDNPDLAFICADEDQIQTIQALALTNGQTVAVSSYCSFTPGGNYNTISGQIKFDGANDGCSNDPAFPYIKVVLNDGISDFATYTDSDGNYTFYTNVGDYTITPVFELPVFTISPSSALVVFDYDNFLTSTNDFCVSANGVNPDLEVVVSPLGAAIPGFDTTYQVTLRNKGNQLMSQPLGLSCTYDYYQMNYVSTNPPADASSNGSIFWNYANLMPFETRTFFCTMHVHAPIDAFPVNAGAAIQVSAAVPSAGDVLASDNTFILNQTAVNSLDPNDILCLEGDSQPTSEIGEYLHYRVRFENTGTAPAQNVVVRIPLNPTQYQVNSLQLLSSSHEVVGRIHNNIAEFMFESIQLNSGGHGNVLLKVRSSNALEQGDSALNRAAIFFDYNLPVETNNAETVFNDLSATSPISDASIQIYPNPASNQITIKTKSTLEKIELYDIQGRLLQISPASGTEFTLQLSQYSSGNYFLNVITDKGGSVQKIIKK